MCVVPVKIGKRGKLVEKEKMSADCGRHLSISKHATAQVWAWPSHNLRRPHDMLNACLCTLVCFNDIDFFVVALSVY